MRRIVLVLGLLMLNGATCYPPVADSGDSTGTDTSSKREAALRAFQSAEEMRNYFADQAVARVTANNTGGDGLGCAGPIRGTALETSGQGTLSPAPTVSDTSGSTAANDAGGDSFSGTNLQEAGVDEGDKVKNDGQYVYLLKGNTVRIVKVNPPDGLQQLASVDLPETADSLYLYGDKLIALSHSWGYWGGYWPLAADGREATATATASDDSSTTPSVIAPTPALPADDVAPVAPDSSGSSVNQTIVTVINIADPSAPVTAATLKFDGDLASSRLIQNKLHLVLTATPPLPADPTPEIIRAEPLDAWLPNYEVTAAGSEPRTGKTAGWESFYYPVNPDGYGITMVITVDVDNPGGEFKPVAISADAGTIYASTSALYITDTNYDYTQLSSREDTVVHKFDLTGDAAAYVASGLVPGRLLNQYSLGENDGYLRMASTVQNYTFSGPIIMPVTAANGAGSSSGVGVADSATAPSSTTTGIAQAATTETQNGHAVYVLHEGSTAGQLDIVGRLEGIASDEQLYSARFIGDRGFLVTFKKVDPLFTIDLRDPTNPKLAGQLKVPGYSEYIHLMDENHLLTIGKDAQDMGDFAWYQGVQLSIFDVTDFANPTLVAKEIIGTRGTDSEANRNPKAFNYWKTADALAIPIDLYEGETTGPEYGEHTFTGLYVYNVTVAEGFKLLGRISTQDTTGSSSGDMPYWYGYDEYTRGVFINDSVYAVTNNVVKSAPLATPSSTIGSLTLPE